MKKLWIWVVCLVGAGVGVGVICAHNQRKRHLA